MAQDFVMDINPETGRIRCVQTSRETAARINGSATPWGNPTADRYFEGVIRKMAVTLPEPEPEELTQARESLLQLGALSKNPELAAAQVRCMAYKFVHQRVKPGEGPACQRCMDRTYLMVEHDLPIGTYSFAYECDCQAGAVVRLGGGKVMNINELDRRWGREKVTQLLKGAA